MATRFYVGVVERGLHGTFGLYFPDLPGCVSAGDTLEGTIKGGAEALAMHIDAMKDHGIPIPAAKPPEAFDADEWEGSDVHSLINFPVDIDADVVKTPPVRLNISLPARLADRVDAAAAEFGYDRSGLLAVAAREWLEKNKRSAAGA